MLNTIISKMKKLNLESQHEQYIELIDTCGDSEDKHLIFRIISSAPGPLNIKLSLIFSLVSKLKKKYDHKLVQDSLEFFNKNQSSFTLEDYEWIVKIIFMIIENIRDKKKNDEIKLKIMETLQKCSQEIDIKPYLFNFMLNDNSWEIVYALLVFMPNLCDSFVREALLQTNLNILKNVSHILSTLSSHHKSLFFNYKHFDSFLDSEHPFLRNCYLDIITNLIPIFKEENNLKEIENIIGILEERINDVYFNVRYKVLNLLGSLFEENSIPMKLRNKLIKKIGERVLDKTILVRKRALTICSYLLMNHPFKSEGSLKRRGGSDDGREVGGSKVKGSKVGNGSTLDDLDKGNPPTTTPINTPNTPLNSLNSNYFKDLNDFHDVFMQILNKVTIYLNSQISGDLQVFIEFIKLCLYYEIEGSREAFEMIFDFVLEGEEDSLSTCFSDIIVRLKMRKISPYSFLKQFIYSNSPSFNQILKVLYKKRIIDNDFYFNVVDLFLKGIDLLECSYLLRNIPKQIEEDLFYNLLKYTTGVLFSVQDSESLSEALKVYCNILKIRVKRGSKGGNVKGSNSSKVDDNGNKVDKGGCSKVDDKVEGNNEPNPNINNLNNTITTLIIKNLAKMVFFDYQTVQVSIQSLYSLSKNPEESISQLLNTLSLKNVNSLKLIYSVGCIGALHLEYLEKLENLAKKKKTKMDTIIPEDIKERRRSINASRLSINSNIEMSILNEMSIGESNCNGDYSKRKKRNTINNTILNNYNNFDQDLSDISDFFFFIKEKDLLYNKDALLYGYSKDIPKYCKEGNDKIQEVSYLTLFKLMCLSSEYFLEHKDLLKSSFKHPNPKIRANSVIAMGDFLLYYNSITEDLSQLLFMNLNDKDLIVKRNTLLIIYILLKKNILRITGNSIHLSKLIFDEEEEIRNIIKTIIRSLDDNFITIMFYEKMTLINGNGDGREGGVDKDNGGDCKEDGREVENRDKVDAFKDKVDGKDNVDKDKENITAIDNSLKTFIDLFIPLLKDKTKELIYLKLLRANLDKKILDYIMNKFNLNEKFINEITMM